MSLTYHEELKYEQDEDDALVQSLTFNSRILSTSPISTPLAESPARSPSSLPRPNHAESFSMTTRSRAVNFINVSSEARTTLDQEASPSEAGPNVPMSQSESLPQRPSTPIPIAENETDERPPGQWARWTRELPWARAKKHNEARGECLKIMITIPLQRELLLARRKTVVCDPEAVLNRMGASIANVESAMMQIVGSVAETPCNHCSLGYGIWSRCVVVWLPELHMIACASCRFNSQDKRCSFNKGARVPPTASRRAVLRLAQPSIRRVHRRIQASQASTVRDVPEEARIQETTASGGAVAIENQTQALHRDYAALKSTVKAATAMLRGINMTHNNPHVASMADDLSNCLDNMDEAIRRF